MYNDYYTPTSSAAIQVSFTQIVMIIIILMVTLVLPIQFIELQRDTAGTAVYSETALQESEAEGRVAGASTTTFSIPFTDLQIAADSETQLLLTAGGGLLAISIIMLFLLVVTTPPKQHYIPELELPAEDSLHDILS